MIDPLGKGTGASVNFCENVASGDSPTGFIKNATPFKGRILPFYQIQNRFYQSNGHITEQCLAV